MDGHELDHVVTGRFHHRLRLPRFLPVGFLQQLHEGGKRRIFTRFEGSYQVYQLFQIGETAPSVKVPEGVQGDGSLGED